MKVCTVGILVADVMATVVTEYPAKGKLNHVDSITLHNGGNAMTAAINLAHMDTPVAIVGKIGYDPLGDYLKGVLDNSGVDTRGLSRTDKVGTSASVVLFDSTGERSFLHSVGTNAVFSIDDIDFKIIEESDLIFVTGTFLMDTFDGMQTAIFLKKCKEMGKITFLDVCWDAQGRWETVLNSAMPYIDYLMPSIDEAINIAKESECEKIADVFMNRGAKNIILKLGKNGCYMRLNGEAKGKYYPALNGVSVVDTTGAGDSFCSGFLAAIARGVTPDKAIEIANATGAMCVTKEGATTGIGTYSEMLHFWEEHR